VLPARGGGHDVRGARAGGRDQLAVLRLVAGPELVAAVQKEEASHDP
jgi:hypothetical protein